MAPTGWKGQIGLLLWKNGLSMKRRKKEVLAEILLPVLFVLLLPLMRYWIKTTGKIFILKKILPVQSFIVCYGSSIRITTGLNNRHIDLWQLSPFGDQSGLCYETFIKFKQ